MIVVVDRPESKVNVRDATAERLPAPSLARTRTLYCVPDTHVGVEPVKLHESSPAAAKNCSPGLRKPAPVQKLPVGGLIWMDNSTKVSSPFKPSGPGSFAVPDRIDSGAGSKSLPGSCSCSVGILSS